MKDITVKSDITIREAMKKLSKIGEKCLAITDEKNMLLGTLSDGDVRKGILKGIAINNSIASIYQQNPTVLYKGKYNQDKAKELFFKYKFDIIPIVDENKTLVDILFMESVISNTSNFQKKEIDVPVVIMAGGKGTRLKPFTNILPKPLVPVHEKPIIEHIIENFTTVGCTSFYLTVNYKARLLKAYFDELNPDYDIDFIEEEKPLGTAGSLHMLDGKLNKPFFVTNCDVIIKKDYKSIYEFHNKGNYDVTLVASAKEYIIPYGTCELNDAGHLSRINEKPSYDFLINTGFYILNPDILKLIPQNQFFHITHLLEKVNSLGKSVGVFPIDEDSWFDIGQWVEYRKAIKKL